MVLNRSHLLLVVLCVLRLQCGGSIYASLEPVDPVIQVGSSLTLSCTLQEGNDVNQTSRSIIWTKSSTPIPSTRYATPNVSTSLLHLHNVTTADAGKYYCQFADDEGSGKPGVHVFIGTPPERVENVTCEAPTLTTFGCTWDNHHHKSNLAVSDNLQFRPAGQITWQTCTQIERTRCECICEDCYDMVDMRVISANVLGNASLQLHPFIFFDIVRPKSVREVSITAPRPGCLTITWQQPFGWNGMHELLSNSIRYRDVDHPTLSQSWTQVQVDPDITTYTLCQLRSYAAYEVMISTLMIFNYNSDGPMLSWSNPVTARTLMTAPSAAPRNLSLNETSESPDWISVTWSPMDPLDENGVIVGYLIYSCTLNSSYPNSLVEDTVSDSKDNDDWTSLLCINETMVENITITSDEHLDDPIEYTLINAEAGQSYLVWVSALNIAGEGPSTDPGMIALPIIPESNGRGRMGVMIVSAITICQIIFIIGLGLCCWQAGLDLFKRNRRLPQPYIPPDVLAMKQEALTPRAPCSGEFFNEPREYKEDRSLLDDPSQLASTMAVSNSGGSSVDHGFYDMQSNSGSNSGSGSSSCSSSQYNSYHYHSASTLRCSVNLTSGKQVVLMKDPETGYSVATSVTNKRDVTLEIENTQPLLTKNGNYDIEEEDEEEDEEDSDGYVNPNNVEPGTVGVSKIILKGNVYDKPTSRHRYQSSQSDTPTVLTSLSDQGFGSADSDPDSRQVSPTDTTSPSFLEFIPSQLDMLIANVDMKDKSDYFGLDEIESICSSMASSRYRSANGEDFPYRLPSITSYQKSSNKSSGSESDLFAGYMSMATKEESDNDYGYVAQDHGNSPIRSDEMAFASSREQKKSISTYDMSEVCSDTPSLVNTTTKTELFCTSSSRDIPSGGNRQTSICITIPTPSSSLSGSMGSSPCSSLASSPLSTVSEITSVHEDRQNIIKRDFEEEGLASDPLSDSDIHTDPTNDHPGEIECGKKGGYVSHSEATKMSAMQSDKTPDTISKAIRSESCRVTIAENPPKKNSLRSILFTDPVSGYVSNAVFT